MTIKCYFANWKQVISQDSFTELQLSLPNGLILFDNHVRRHGQDGACRHYGECCEEEETHPVQHHRSELPVSFHCAGLVILPHLVRDHLKLLQDEAELPL